MKISFSDQKIGIILEVHVIPYCVSLISIQLMNWNCSPFFTRVFRHSNRTSKLIAFMFCLSLFLSSYLIQLCLSLMMKSFFIPYSFFWWIFQIRKRFPASLKLTPSPTTPMQWICMCLYYTALIHFFTVGLSEVAQFSCTSVHVFRSLSTINCRNECILLSIYSLQIGECLVSALISYSDVFLCFF